ncbi:MAG: hypothetical protein FLDDKLPJ_01946 [Phycisphaerae bacterium]|nr:hypothetical protein [Phycisphaerae bacterium]
MSLWFEWDSGKAAGNLKKHGVTFEEASTVLGDAFSLTIEDELHSREENRFVTIGRSTANRVLVVVHADRREAIRLISARPATRRERKQYEKAIKETASDETP